MILMIWLCFDCSIYRVFIVDTTLSLVLYSCVISTLVYKEPGIRSLLRSET